MLSIKFHNLPILKIISSVPAWYCDAISLYQII